MDRLICSIFRWLGDDRTQIIATTGARSREVSSHTFRIALGGTGAQVMRAERKVAHPHRGLIFGPSDPLRQRGTTSSQPLLPAQGPVVSRIAPELMLGSPLQCAPAQFGCSIQKRLPHCYSQICAATHRVWCSRTWTNQSLLLDLLCVNMANTRSDQRKSFTGPSITAG